MSAGAPTSASTMCAFCSTMISSPGWVCALMQTSLPIEPGRQDAVEGGWRAAALHVTEDRDARLEPRALLDLGRERVADAAEPHVPEGILLLRHQLPGSFLGRRALGDDDDRERAAALV